MTNSLVFFVPGTPAPQGSKRHVGGGRMVESSAKVKPWREDVRAAAETAMQDQAWGPDDADQPLDVEIYFYLQRPVSHPKRRRTTPDKKPDLDKLIRSTADALTSAGALKDDARIVRLTAQKRYVHPPELRRSREEIDRPGATIHIYPANQEQS